MTDQIISQDGYEKLKQELDTLIRRRKEIADRIQSAKDLGDLSENAEYAEAKDAQAFNEGRIVELAALLKNVTVVHKESKSQVGMGSVVIVKSNGNSKEFTIVSFNEVDPLAGKISNESPLGRAFLNKKKGDVVTITTPKGETSYEIIEVK